MSELINTKDNRATIRWKLLTGVSALTLSACLSSANMARAEDAERPPLWIEFGAQMEQVQGLSAPFIAPFMTAITPTPDVYAGDIFTRNQRPARFAFGGEGKISFQPEDSDWIFSAGIRYGRSNAESHKHQSGSVPYTTFGGHFGLRSAKPLADIKATNGDNHAILDFSAGKDVGLGKFGRDGTSTFSAGIRFAQFSSNANVDAIGRPSIQLFHSYYGRKKIITFYNYTMAAQSHRDFHGVGPSLSWTASAALAGNKQDGELALDWGIDGALLFGRQKAKINHTTQAYHLPFTANINYVGYYYTKTYVRPHHSTRSKRVTVPNVAAFAGLSWQTEHAKVSIGYRYDTFIGAMDTGIDAAKKSNVTFNGPYASISFGLGN